MVLILGSFSSHRNLYNSALGPWGLIWLLKKVEEILWMFQVFFGAEKLRNFRSNSPTESAQQRNLENRISQLLWQLLWYPGSWVTFFFFFRGSGRYYIHSTCLIRSVARKFVEIAGGLFGRFETSEFGKKKMDHANSG